MPELIRVDAAAKMLDRTTRTLRRWCERGFAPDGTNIRVVARDQFSKYPYVERAVIERLAAKRLLPVA